ncbi:MAG: AmmeMemoRadiSam system protein B [Spirochaeta sp.]
MMSSGIREPAVAGRFYPADQQELARTVSGMLAEADKDLRDRGLSPSQWGQSPNASHGSCRGVIAPHAGYAFSGPTAALSFAAARAAWTGRTPSRAVLLGPAHYVACRQLTAPNAQFFATPVGRHPVDVEAVQYLAADGRVSLSDAAHQPEHSLEVMLPFVHAVWSELPVLPLLCGGFGVQEAAEILDEVLRTDDILIISSDLSHFYPPETAERLDVGLLQSWERRDPDGVLAGEACGKVPILVSMELALRHNWQPQLLGYTHSGAMQGGRESVVGYGSGIYTQS